MNNTKKVEKVTEAIFKEVKTRLVLRLWAGRLHSTRMEQHTRSASTARFLGAATAFLKDPV